MNSHIDLQRYPLDQPSSLEYQSLVEHCRAELDHTGMFNLHGLVPLDVCARAVDEIMPTMNNASFEHRRWHNIYFLDEVPGLEADHPALRKVETVNHTVCADQMADSIVIAVYEYSPLLRFLADVMQKSELYLMDDPLARANVMAYREGEALNWHFDRSEFTTTLLLQSPEVGGEFEYRSDLRSDDDPNYPGVEQLLMGEDSNKQLLKVEPGTLNVFRGKNTAHRVTRVEGNRERVIAVFSYYEFPGKLFSEPERIGFYGRAE
ncbi:MAG: 2OG-Fe(II) oxygenase [Pseudomonadota bacterium]